MPLVVSKLYEKPGAEVTIAMDRFLQHLCRYFLLEDSGTRVCYIAREVRSCMIGISDKLLAVVAEHTARQWSQRGIPRSSVVGVDVFTHHNIWQVCIIWIV